MDWNTPILPVVACKCRIGPQAPDAHPGTAASAGYARAEASSRLVADG